MVLANTLGEHNHHTWHAPNGWTPTQIDYIMVQNHYKSGVSRAKTRTFLNMCDTRRLLKPQRKTPRGKIEYRKVNKQIRERNGSMTSGKRSNSQSLPTIQRKPFSLWKPSLSNNKAKSTTSKTRMGNALSKEKTKRKDGQSTVQNCTVFTTKATQVY